MWREQFKKLKKNKSLPETTDKMVLFRSENWNKLSSAQKIRLLQEVENDNARKFNRPPATVSQYRSKPGENGVYYPGKNAIKVKLQENGYVSLHTLLHEGQHARQEHYCKQDVQPSTGLSDDIKQATLLEKQPGVYDGIVPYELSTMEMDADATAMEQLAENDNIFKGDPKYSEYLVEKLDNAKLNRFAENTYKVQQFQNDALINASQNLTDEQKEAIRNTIFRKDNSIIPSNSAIRVKEGLQNYSELLKENNDLIQTYGATQMLVKELDDTDGKGAVIDETIAEEDILEDEALDVEEDLDPEELENDALQESENVTLETGENQSIDNEIEVEQRQTALNEEEEDESEKEGEEEGEEPDEGEDNEPAEPSEDEGEEQGEDTAEEPITEEDILEDEALDVEEDLDPEESENEELQEDENEVISEDDIAEGENLDEGEDLEAVSEENDTDLDSEGSGSGDLEEENDLEESDDEAFSEEDDLDVNNETNEENDEAFSEEDDLEIDNETNDENDEAFSEEDDLEVNNELNEENDEAFSEEDDLEIDNESNEENDETEGEESGEDPNENNDENNDEDFDEDNDEDLEEENDEDEGYRR